MVMGKDCSVTIPERGRDRFDPEELADAVHLTEFSVLNDACVEPEAAVRIVTSSQQWAYAAVWPIHDAGLPCGSTSEFVLRVEATIGQGRIGIAIARDDLREFIGQEKECGASPQRQELEIRIAGPVMGKHLVIRNTAPGGTPSVAVIHSIRVYLANESRKLSSIECKWGTPVAVPNDEPPPIMGIPDVLPRGGGGTEVFDTPEAQRINQARLDHLSELGLPLEGKSVLDVGCGVGHLSRFFTGRGCHVTCVDARPENLDRLETLYPGTAAHVAHAELNSLAHLGRFDVVFCYGTLYHTENPIAVLRNMASCCRDLLLLETVVTDYPLPIVQLVDEPNITNNQAASGFGCRPTPAFVAMALGRMGFAFVYTSREQPDFPDFHCEWKGDGAWQRDGHLLRRVFVASRTQLDNSHLVLLQHAPRQACEEREFQRLAATAAPEIWLDVGAHFGEKTLPLAAQNPDIRVYAFEPNLRIALASAGRLPNYIMLAMAVSEQDGNAPLYVNRFDAASSLLPFVPDGLKKWVGGECLHVDSTVLVPTIRLDTFLNQAGISRVAYLKIDAQGADLAVVRSLGARLRDVERISLEVQTTPVPLYRDASRKEDVVSLLTSAGFQLISCEKQSFDQEENLTFIRIQ